MKLDVVPCTAIAHLPSSEPTPSARPRGAIRHMAVFIANMVGDDEARLEIDDHAFAASTGQLQGTPAKYKSKVDNHEQHKTERQYL